MNVFRMAYKVGRDYQEAIKKDSTEGFLTSLDTEGFLTSLDTATSTEEPSQVDLFFSHLKQEGIIERPNTLREEQMAEASTSAQISTSGLEFSDEEASGTVQPALTIDEIKEWNTQEIINRLGEKYPGKISEKALDILKDNEIDGDAFLELTEENLMQWRMAGGPAILIAKYIKELKANQAESSKTDPIQTFELLVKPRTTTTIVWSANTDETTIGDLKDVITANYSEKKEEAENAQIEIFFDKGQQTIMANDNHLRNALKSFARSGIKKFTVAFHSSSKPYNKWTIKEVLKYVLYSEIQEYSDLPDLDIDKLLTDNPITIDNSHKDWFIQTLKIIYEAFDGSIQNNEAMSRNYINAFMHGAVPIINQLFKRKLLKLTVESDLNGSLGFGKVDYAFLLFMYAILVTEAKALEIPQGVAQNLVQLHTASEKLKRKRDNTPALSAVFGIVSTGRNWRFICWNTSPGKPTVQLSKEYICRFEGEMQDEMNVLQIISTILYIQAREMVTLFDNGEIEIDEPKVAKRMRTSDSSSA